MNMLKSIIKTIGCTGMAIIIILSAYFFILSKLWGLVTLI